MLEGCDILTDAVQVTLGPNGRNVLIDQGYGPVKITKDGVTVAKAIELSDRFANMGASLIKSVSSKTNDEGCALSVQCALCTIGWNSFLYK